MLNSYTLNLSYYYTQVGMNFFIDDMLKFDISIFTQAKVKSKVMFLVHWIRFVTI